jgi:hypothetical protein
MADRPHVTYALAPLPADVLGGPQRAGLLVGATGLVGGVAGLLLGVSAEQFFRSYLIGFMFCLGIALGSLAIVMLHHLTSGGWGMVARRPFEAAARTLPLVTLFFLPIALFGLHPLYHWTHAEAVAADPVLQWKQPYLNVPFFLVRAAIYFAIWNGLAIVLTRWSREQDAEGLQPPGAERRFRVVSAPGLLVYALTITFASVDWVMSLDPHWFSMISGFSSWADRGSRRWRLS